MYKPGRKYQGIMMPKGKGSDKRAPKPYLREEREPVQVAPGKVEMQPVSWKKIVKFLKEQCEELKDFIAETNESRFLGHVHVEKVEEEKVEEEMVEEEVMEEVNEEEVVEQEFEIEEISFNDDHVMEIEDISDDEN